MKTGLTKNSTTQSLRIDYTFNGIICLFFISTWLVSCDRQPEMDPWKKHASYQHEADSLLKVAEPYLGSGNDSLNYYASQLEALGESYQDTALIVDAKIMKARYQLRVSNYQAAMKVSLEALTLSQIKGLANQLPEIYSIIGNAYKENEYYEGALSAAEKGMQAAKKIKDTQAIIGAMLEYAMFTHSYSMLKDNDSIAQVSLELYLDGLRLATSSPKYERQTIPFLDNISQHYLLTKDFAKGIFYGKEGERMARKYKKKRSLTYSLNWLGEIYFRQGNHKSGMAYLDTALQYAKDLNLYYRVSEILTSKYECYKLAGDPQNALANFVRSRAIRDSLQMLQNIKQVNLLQVQYETGKKDQEIAMLSQINKQKKKETTWILSGFTVFVLLSVFLAYQYRTLNHRNKLLKNSYNKINQQSEKLKLLMKELHHRVKNNLQIVSSLLSLQSTHLSDAKALQAVQTGQQRVHAMSLIHRSLYQQDNPNMVNMPEYIEGLLNSILASFGKEKENMNLQMDVGINELDVDMALPIGLIVNEWVTNSFKHAFKDILLPSIRLMIKADKHLVIEIEDNGPGMKLETWENPKGSFGVKLVKVLSKQLGGNCVMHNDSGTRLCMVIPMKTLKEAV